MGGWGTRDIQVAHLHPKWWPFLALTGAVCVGSWHCESSHSGLGFHAVNALYHVGRRCCQPNNCQTQAEEEGPGEVVGMGHCL